jgi:hypothetical protein
MAARASLGSAMTWTPTPMISQEAYRLKYSIKFVRGVFWNNASRRSSAWIRQFGRNLHLADEASFDPKGPYRVLAVGSI